MAAGYRSLLAFWTGGASKPAARKDTLYVALIPIGGCAGNTDGFLIVGVPNSADALLEGPREQSLRVGVPVGAQIQFRQRRQKPYVLDS